MMWQKAIFSWIFGIFLPLFEFTIRILKPINQTIAPNPNRRL